MQRRGVMKTSAWRRQRRPSTTELFYWSTSTTELFYWSTSTILTFFYWSTSTRLRFSTGRRRPDWGFRPVDVLVDGRRCRRPSTPVDANDIHFTDVFITPQRGHNLGEIFFLPGLKSESRFDIRSQNLKIYITERSQSWSGDVRLRGEFVIWCCLALSYSYVLKRFPNDKQDWNFRCIFDILFFLTSNMCSYYIFGVA